MDRRTFLYGLSVSAFVAPAFACADAAASRQRDEIEIIVHKDPG